VPLCALALGKPVLRPLQAELKVPKTCATWARALQGAVERSVCAGPVVARLEVG
jgi:hypothetical protein